MRVTKTISTDKARQGRKGQQVLYVLIAALILAAIVWAGVELYGQQIDTTSEGTAVETPAN